MDESARVKIDPCRSIVRVRNLSVQLGYHRVLHDVSFDLLAGHVLVVLGPNATGKTTLLKTLANAIMPDQGHIELDMELSPESAIGWVGHQSFLYDELSVRENLRFWADLQNVKNASRRVDELIDQFGLRLFADERIDTLSFGSVRRVSICRSLLCEPQLLLLDEAFNGLDQAGVDHLLRLINSYKKTSGAVILTSHQISLGLDVATDILVLNKGRSILNGNLDRFDRQALNNDYLTYVKKVSSELSAEER